MHQFQAEIKYNNLIAQDCFELGFSWKKDIKYPLPGQFITIRCSENYVPLLRRPFAVSSFDRDCNIASIIYLKKGSGTQQLSGKRPGETIDIIGPMGNSFRIDNSKTNIFVAGGIGLGPILFSLAQYAENGKGKTFFVYGCRTKVSIPSIDYFKNANPIICTDDGSDGYHGTPVSYLESFLKKELGNCVIYACGPMGLLSSCHGIALKYGVDCFVSVEQVMACGVGACMGCVVKNADHHTFKRTCIDGPIFNTREIEWT